MLHAVLCYMQWFGFLCESSMASFSSFDLISSCFDITKFEAEDWSLASNLYPTWKESLSGELPSKTGCFHFIHAFKTEVSVLKDVQDVLAKKKKSII